MDDVKVNTKLPFCQVSLELDQNSRLAMIEGEGSPPPMKVSGQEMKIQVISSTGSYDSTKPEDAGPTMLQFRVNPFFDGMFGQSYGAMITNQEGNHTESKLKTLTCTGTRIRIMDIKLILGDLAEAKHLIK
ncbi:MAG: hypothetical protein EOP06_10990 [Proteobacteria bacterium]|nr:MAG: hypothetical protein EOP06_10990 [Pseudomonadota bacterium]